MLSVTKEFTFDSAHKLRDYDGKCKNLHGHTYKLLVTVYGERETLEVRNGMLIDFGDLKGVVHRQVIDKLDHNYLNDIPPFHYYNPTAENMCVWIFGQLKGYFKMFLEFKKLKIRLYETPTSYAEYEKEL